MSRRRSNSGRPVPLIARLWAIRLGDDGQGQRRVRGAFRDLGYPLEDVSDGDRVAESAIQVRRDVAQVLRQCPRNPVGDTGRTCFSSQKLVWHISAWLRPIGLRATFKDGSDPQVSLGILPNAERNVLRSRPLDLEDRMRACLALDLLHHMNRADWHLLKVCAEDDGCSQWVFVGNRGAGRCPRCQERFRRRRRLDVMPALHLRKGVRAAEPISSRR